MLLEPATSMEGWRAQWTDTRQKPAIANFSEPIGCPTVLVPQVKGCTSVNKEPLHASSVGKFCGPSPFHHIQSERYKN